MLPDVAHATLTLILVVAAAVAHSCWRRTRDAIAKGGAPTEADKRLTSTRYAIVTGANQPSIGFRTAQLLAAGERELSASRCRCRPAGLTGGGQRHTASL
jgi:hypothetical protein